MTELSYCIAGVTVCCLFLLTPSAHYAERRLCNDRVSVRLSVCPIYRPQQPCAAGVHWAPCWQKISINRRRWHSAATVPQHGTQQQTRTVSRLQPLQRANTDLFKMTSLKTTGSPKKMLKLLKSDDNGNEQLTMSHTAKCMYFIHVFYLTLSFANAVFVTTSSLSINQSSG